MRNLDNRRGNEFGVTYCEQRYRQYREDQDHFNKHLLIILLSMCGLITFIFII